MTSRLHRHVLRRALASAVVLASAGGLSLAQGADEAPPAATREALWDAWLDVWNGDPSRAAGIIAPDMRLHATLLDGRPDTAVRGPDGITGWVAQMRTLFPDLRFEVVVGPLIDGEHLTGHWRAKGSYAGGFPGATAPAGTVVEFGGTDALRLEDRLIAEYRLAADTADMLTQLGVGG